MADRALIRVSDAGYRIHRACTRAHAPAACACTAYCTRSDVHRAHTALAAPSIAGQAFCWPGTLSVHIAGFAARRMRCTRADLLQQAVGRTCGGQAGWHRARSSKVTMHQRLQ